MNSNPVLKAIFARRSVRKFTGAPVPYEDFETIARAAMAAPSGRNQQPWAFVIITDRAQCERLRAELPYAKMLDRAGGALCVCGDTRDKYWLEDGSAAIQNALLACESLGYGAVWTAVYPTPERVECVRRILGVPEPWMPIAVIPIGVPDGEHLPHDNFKPEKIRRDRW